jgi:hypothetical protein
MRPHLLLLLCFCAGVLLAAAVSHLSPLPAPPAFLERP